VPIGTGGGDSPKPGQSEALSRRNANPLAMDNALFAVNCFTLVGGVSVARVTPGFTVQAEAGVRCCTKMAFGRDSGAPNPPPARR